VERERQQTTIKTSRNVGKNDTSSQRKYPYLSDYIKTGIYKYFKIHITILNIS
jgi:hypothetical protein